MTGRDNTANDMSDARFTQHQLAGVDEPKGSPIRSRFRAWRTSRGIGGTTIPHTARIRAPEPSHRFMLESGDGAAVAQSQPLLQIFGESLSA